MSAARAGLAATGALAAAYGGFRLLEQGWDNLVATAVWLAGGVFLHDGVLGPLTVLLCAAGIALAPRHLRAPAAAGLVVLATVTISAIPVLGRFGAREDNPTLLDRDYVLGWAGFVVLVLVAVVVAAAARSRRAGRGGD